MISVTGTQADQATSDQTPIDPFTGVAIDDGNVSQTETVTVTESTTANGVVVDPNAATDGSTTNGNGVWTVIGSAAAVTADLDALVFQPTAGEVPYGQSVTTSFAIAVTDTDGDTASDTTTSVVATAMLPLKVLVNFNGTQDGSGEQTVLLSDANGDLFGTTTFGGADNDGTVFELPNTAPGYPSSYPSTPTTLFSFDGSDGDDPFTGLISDANGDLFGTARDGTVFELENTATGYASAPTVLATFTLAQGTNPVGGLLADARGDLFGTMAGGGADGDGTVYEIPVSPASPTGYANSPTILASFSGMDGASPDGALTADANGDLFGVTSAGGADGQGTVYEIVNTATGYSSTPVVLVSFNGSDGASPIRGLVTDAAGDLFGVTPAGGANGDGTVFEIPVSPASPTGYASTPTDLVSFNGTDGAQPVADFLLVDANGDLFGTTSGGGAYGYGTIFEIVTTTTGYATTPTVLESLNGTDGSGAFAGLIANAAGDLFSTAFRGGTNNDGTLFELTDTPFVVDPIAITGTQAEQATSDQTQIDPFAGVAISDPNLDQTETVTVAESATANGVLVDPNAATDGSTINGNGVWTVIGSAAAVTVDLDALVFQPTAGEVPYGQSVTTGFTLNVADTLGVSASDTTTSVVATAMLPLKVLVNFNGTQDGSGEQTVLLSDANGDLFGTTTFGGADNDGTVFELPNTAPGYPSSYPSTPTTLFSFDGSDGDDPFTGLISDANGDLFGTARDGTVFELENTATGYASAPTVLATFTLAQGTNPVGGLLADARGDLFGTMAGGGADGDGTVYEIPVSPASPTGYANSPTILASFSGMDGASPDGALTADANGDLFGVTSAGGADGQGTVYEIVNTATGYSSTPVVLVSFNGSDGASPIRGLVTDAAGDLFGVTPAGGANGDGTVFEIPVSPASPTGYASTPTDLVSFNGTDGAQPVADFLLVDANGDLFGTTSGGGAYGYGTIFEIVTTTTGYATTPTVLESLNGTDGSGAFAGLIADAAGDLFSTAFRGGTNSDGTLFELTDTPFVVDPISLGGMPANQVTTDPTDIDPFAQETISDPNLDQIETVTVTQSATANGTLIDPNAASDDSANSNGVWTVMGSVAEVNADLNALVFQPTTDQVPPGQSVTTGFTVTVSDSLLGNAASDTTSVIANNVPMLKTLASLNYTDGAEPEGGLVADADGDLFGAALVGGTDGGWGTVFEIANTPTGYIGTPLVLASFNDTTDGIHPINTIIDTSGDLFVTATNEGTHQGVVDELADSVSGDAGTLTPIAPLSAQSGGYVVSGLLDVDGNLIGAAGPGGTSGDWTLFEIVNTATGYASTATVLVNITGAAGTFPSSNMIVDPSGDLLGAAALGGANNDGAVYEIANTATGYASTATLIASFNGTDGDGLNGVVADANGNLFGTTSNGGQYGDGTVFEIANTATGYASTPKVLLNFDGTDGASPTSGLIVDGNGDLFGTTEEGGGGEGTVFEIANTATGYASTPAWAIDFDGGNGAAPIGGLFADASGDLFGTTSSGGEDVDGTVFEITNSGFVPGALCFCVDTLISTPKDQVKVQDLAVGDMVMTWSSVARPIVWIGTGKVLATRGRRTAATPVIVRKGALADNVPHCNLRITKGHSLYIDSVLIPVEFLVNHRSILWDDRAREVTVFHVELATHDVLIANGAPAESYRDDGNRWLFQNANSGWGLPPQKPCAPVLTGGPSVDAIWRRMLERAGPRPGLPLTDDPDLYLVVDDERIDAVSHHGSAHIFALPVVAAGVRVASRAGAPAELGLARDPRVLGVAIRRVALRQGARFRVMEAADPALADGFHDFEPANGFRWTDGDAGLPAALFEGFEGPMELVLHIGATMQYPLFREDVGQAAA